MAHESMETLKAQCAYAHTSIEVGALYAHYRDADMLYKIIAVALDEATEETCVVYQALYGDQLIWVRKLANWCEMVEHNGMLVLRFSLVRSA